MTRISVEREVVEISILRQDYVPVITQETLGLLFFRLYLTTPLDLNILMFQAIDAKFQSLIHPLPLGL